MTDIQPTAPPCDMATLIGPFYDKAGVAPLLANTAAEPHLLELETSDSHTVYPAFQFTATGVDPNLQPLIKALAEAPHWAAALWFVTPNDDLNNATPLNWIREGKLVEAALTSARATAADWK